MSSRWPSFTPYYPPRRQYLRRRLLQSLRSAMTIDEIGRAQEGVWRPGVRAPHPQVPEMGPRQAGCDWGGRDRIRQDEPR